jgi:hypothetical protein
VSQSPSQAAEILRGITREVSAQEVPSVEQALEGIRRFERVEFDVPVTSDSDGFLFEYGEANWLARPAFVIGYTRQLEIVDPNGEHQDYLQVQMEFQYPLDEELRNLEGHNSWWFRGGDGAFIAWLDSTARNSIWHIIQPKEPVAFTISQSLV